jgi:hypothetical protein
VIYGPEWTCVTEQQEITLHIQGSVHMSPKVTETYVTLTIGHSQYMMHDTMARQLRDWLIANVPDDTPDRETTHE